MEHNKEELLRAVEDTKAAEAPPIPQNGMRNASPRRLHKNKTQYMVTLSMLIALVVVLQFVGAMIPPIGPTSLSFVLIPIVIGGLVLGVKAGGILGLTFGVVTVIRGLMGLDALTTHLMFYNSAASNMLLTICVCLVKAIAAGILPPLVHRLLYHRAPRASVIVASAVAPIVNTALFAFGMLFLLEPLAALVGNSAYFLGFTILVCNFLPELAINLVASPAIYRVMHVVSSKRFKR